MQHHLDERERLSGTRSRSAHGIHNGAKLDETAGTDPLFDRSGRLEDEAVRVNPVRDDLGEATRTIVEGKSGYLIDGGSGFSIRYPNKAAAQAQIDRLERAEHEAEEDRAAQRIARLAAVNEYLAREASTPTRLTLF